MPWDADGNPIRSKDLKKKGTEWEEREVVWECPNGMTVERIRTRSDFATEGRLMGHCGDTHAFWSHIGVELFFSLRAQNGTPHCTIFAKKASLLGKDHPVDHMRPAEFEAAYGSEIPKPWTRSNGYEYFVKDSPFGKNAFEYEGEKWFLLQTHARGYNNPEPIAMAHKFIEHLGAKKQPGTKQQYGDVPF